MHVHWLCSCRRLVCVAIDCQGGGAATLRRSTAWHSVQQQQVSLSASTGMVCAARLPSTSSRERTESTCASSSISSSNPCCVRAPHQQLARTSRLSPRTSFHTNDHKPPQPTQIRDPRVPAGDNDAFLDLMEAYFGRSDAQKAPDARPDLAYQVGVCVCVLQSMKV